MYPAVLPSHDAVARRRAGEDRVDRPEYRRSRAKRVDQRHFRELLNRRRGCVSEILTYTLECRGFGALEAEDSTAWHRRRRTPCGAAREPFAGEELLRQRRHHLHCSGLVSCASSMRM
jgi:hypothetical protein